MASFGLTAQDRICTVKALITNSHQANIGPVYTLWLTGLGHPGDGADLRGNLPDFRVGLHRAAYTAPSWASLQRPATRLCSGTRSIVAEVDRVAVNDEGGQRSLVQTARHHDAGAGGRNHRYVSVGCYGLAGREACSANHRAAGWRLARG